MTKEINIQIINRCQLRCKFCARSWLPTNRILEIGSSVMSLDNFKRIIDKCVESGRTQICLTPRIGEVFLDPTFKEKVTYLEENLDIE